VSYCTCTCTLCPNQKINNFLTECETRSVTPTSELADKQIDIDEEFAAVTAAAKKFTTVTKSTRVKTKIVHKRA
jgi:hypothetical protein